MAVGSREDSGIIRKGRRTVENPLEGAPKCGTSLRPAGESSSLGDRLGDARRNQCICARVLSDPISDRLGFLDTRASKRQ